MKCYYCGGDMKKGRTTYTINKKGYHLLIDDINAWLCSQCGEAYFEGGAVEAIQDVIITIENKVGKLREEKVAV